MEKIEKTEKEIDLLKLFTNTCNSISKLVINILVYLYKMFFKYLYLYIIFFLLGTGYSIYKNYVAGQDRSATATFIIDNKIGYNNIRYLIELLNNDLKNENYVNLENLIKINKDTLEKNIKGISVIRDLIDTPNEKRLVEGKIIDIPQPPISLNSIIITYKSGTTISSKKFKGGIKNYINNNEYINSIKQRHKIKSQRQIDRLKLELKQIDEFQKKMLDNDKFRTVKIANDKFILGNNETYEKKVISLSNQVINLEMSINIIPIRFVSNFVEKPKISVIIIFIKSIIYFTLSATLLIFFINLLIFIKEETKKKSIIM